MGGGGGGVVECVEHAAFAVAREIESALCPFSVTCSL